MPLALPAGLAVLLLGVAAPLAWSQGAPCEYCQLAKRAHAAHRRAGCPQSVAPLARPSNTSAYTGGYVGGGTAWGGCPRQPQQGTWGWDYQGLLFPKKIWLNWNSSRRQGGTGAYEPDGPKLLHHD